MPILSARVREVVGARMSSPRRRRAVGVTPLRSRLYRVLTVGERRKLKTAIDEHRRQRLRQAGVIGPDGRLCVVSLHD